MQKNSPFSKATLTLSRVQRFPPMANLSSLGSDDRTMRLWEVSSAKRTHHFPRPPGQHCSLFPRWQTCPSLAHDDGTARLWDPSSAKELNQNFQGDTDSMFSVTFSPNGKQVLTCSLDGTARLWDPACKKNSPLSKAIRAR